MKKYRIRKNSPAYWLQIIIGLTLFILFMSIPSTIEGLL